MKSKNTEQTRTKQNEKKNGNGGPGVRGGGGDTNSRRDDRMGDLEEERTWGTTRVTKRGRRTQRWGDTGTNSQPWKWNKTSLS